MTDPLLAQQADLEDLLQSTVAEDQALLLLTGCSDAARDYTGQFISFVDGDTVTLRGNDRETVTLPEWPVTAVTEVLEIASGDAPTDGTALVNEEDYYATTAGVLVRIGGGTWMAGYRYQVTYDHGWDPIKPSTVMAVAKMAARVAATAGLAGTLASESIGDYSYTLSTAASATSAALSAMTPEEQALLAPLVSRGLA